LIAVIFLHLFDSSKTTAGLAPSLFGREPGGDSTELGHLQVGEDFTLQFPIETPLANQRQQTTRRQSKLHDSASSFVLTTNRATSAVALSQLATATLSCFVPALVRE
jgi:hypothetical protein